MTTTLSASPRTLRSVVHIAFVILASICLVLGDVLAFNQLATQSATDAILQLVVFAVGGAGVFECLRRAFCSHTSRGRLTAIVPGLLSIAAFIAWRSQVSVGWLVVITGAGALALGAVTVRLLWAQDRSGESERDQLLGLLCLAQLIVFAYVGVLAIVDAGSTLFG